LRGLATAAQDVSDGVLADLGHIARQSNVAMEIESVLVPIAPVVSALCTPEKSLLLALTAGDDYELVFTAPSSLRAEVQTAAAECGVPATRIGRVVAGSGVSVRNPDGSPLQPEREGYDHFSDVT
jgi:thiamine-monophosphate kinase